MRPSPTNAAPKRARPARDAIANLAAPARYTSLGLSLLSVIVSVMAMIVPEARAVTPTLILGGNRVGEFQGVRGSDFIAWQQNSRRHPGHFDVLARRLDGGEAFKVNPKGTNGANGAIDGDVLVYQQFKKKKSDLRFYDLADRTRSSPPRGVNTRQWEYWPSISNDHLLFGRLNLKGRRQLILFDDASRFQTRLDKIKGAHTFLAPGQVNGDYAVWSTCTSAKRCKVFRYRISDGTRTVVPNSGQRDHAPSVTPDGLVYFARSGGKCGSGTKLVRFLPGGPVTTLWRLPSGDDVSTTRAHLESGGPTTIYYDHFACGSKVESDVWEIVEQGPIQLSVTVQGAGTVTSSPPGISCGSDCSEIYAVGTGVTLTATPQGSAVFAGWSGACTGTGTTCSLTMDGPRSVTATFSNKPVLTVSKAGSGGGRVTSSPAGIDCGADCTEPYDQGTTVTLTASADNTSAFAGWSGACSGTGPCIVTMDASKSVIATFGGVAQQLTVTLAGDGSGTVTSSPGAINCPSICSDTFAPGTVVTLTAAEGQNSDFIGWSGCTVGSDPLTCTVTVSGLVSVTATFARPGNP